MGAGLIVRYGVAATMISGLLVIGASAQAADGGADGATMTDAGGISCASTDDCGLPTPYCDEVRHTCVECLSDRNCASSTGLCDAARGVCVPCFSDLDCAAPNPYCSDALGRCVECRTDSNCADEGVQCMDGLCGSCGDGVCAARERVLIEYGPFGSPQQGAGAVQCREDCVAFCGEIDLGSAANVSSGVITTKKNRFSGGCGALDGPDVSFKWTAPETGTYFIDAIGSSPGTALNISDGMCSFFNGCTSGVDAFVTTWDFSAGDEIVFVLQADAATGEATYVLNVADHCDGEQCPGVVVTPGQSDSGSSSDPSASCLANAAGRGDTMCAGIECACEHCPQAYDDCAVIPNCESVRDCMQTKGCVGADCYNSGMCRTVIDSYGGVSGPAFRAAATLQSCVLSYACTVPCGAADGGVSSDAGRLCEPGRTVVCTCDGGVEGEQVCAEDGQSFEPCTCGGSETNADDGCGCRIASRTVTGFGPLYLLMAIEAFRRARRARRRVVREVAQ